VAPTFTLVFTVKSLTVAFPLAISVAPIKLEPVLPIVEALISVPTKSPDSVKPLSVPTLVILGCDESITVLAVVTDIA
jgi:hypothetical protein